MTSEPIDCVQRLLRDAREQAENPRTEHNINDALELLDAIETTGDVGPPAAGPDEGDTAPGTVD